MENRILNYCPQPYGEYQLGFCTVDMSGKCIVILKVLKSKTGNPYCAFNSVKIGDSWLPDFAFSNKDFQRSFLDDCLEKIKPMMNHPTENQEEKDPNQEGLPF